MAKVRVECDEDFGNMMISAIRYGLWRRTYITGLTADYIIPLIKKGAFSPRVLTVMDRDLAQYEKDRKFRIAEYEKSGKEEWKWAIDDDCDFQAWSGLHKAVCDKIKEMKDAGDERFI